ncbi:MAG: hypothetical protein P8R54_06410 [Myxococcota bacterium]|nr:hypothetical protein [Myxococcota bacterium]
MGDLPPPGHRLEFAISGEAAGADSVRDLSGAIQHTLAIAPGG